MVNKFFTFEAGRYQSGLTDILATLYDVDGTVVQSGTMSEIGSTGIYQIAFSIATAGSYAVVFDTTNSFNAGNAEVIKKSSEGFIITSSTLAPDSITTLNTTYLHVKYRLDDIEANLGEGSANIVSQAISGAQSHIDQLTNSATGNLITFAVADLAAAEVVDTVLGRDDQTVSNEREAMARRLRERAFEKVKSLGYDVKYSFANK